MVKIAFLVEGETEEILISHLKNIDWFIQFNIKIVSIINLKGNGNFCSKNIDKFIAQANSFKPDKIIILTDLECDPCIKKTKERLGSCSKCTTIIARKAIESWFLADTILMQKITENEVFICNHPEKTSGKPFEDIVKILKENNAKGTGPSKPRFLKRLIKQGFDIDRANKHIDINSLKYFIDKLKSFSKRHIS